MVARTRAALAALSLAGCTSITPHMILDRPPRPVGTPEKGETVAHLSREGITVMRTKLTDYKPVDCAPIERMLIATRNQMGVAPAIGIYGGGMQRQAGNPALLSNYQNFQSALERCQKADYEYRFAAIRVVAVNETGPAVALYQLGQMGFEEAGDTAFLTTNLLTGGDINNSCFALQDWHGRFLPVRSDPDDPYRFRFDEPRRELMEGRARHQAASLEQQRQEMETRLQTASRALLREPAFREDRCVRPEMEAIPPKPEGMSPEKVEYHSVGGCMKQLYATYTQSEASDAFGRYGLYKEMDIAREWSSNRGYQESECGLNNLRPSEMQASGLTVWSAVLGNRAPSAAAIKGLYDRCVERAEQSCNGPVLAWEAQRRSIITAPSRLLRSCEAALGTYQELQAAVPQSRRAAEQGRLEGQDRLRLAASIPAPVGNAALSRCGSESQAAGLKPSQTQRGLKNEPEGAAARSGGLRIAWTPLSQERP